MAILIDNKPNASTQLNAILQAFPDLLFTLDESGVILDYKAGDAASLLFAPPEVFIGQRVELALPRELAGNLLKALQDIRTKRETVSFEYSLGQPGSERWFEARAGAFVARSILSWLCGMRPGINRPKRRSSLN